MSWLLPRLNHGAGRLSSYIQSQHLISSRTAWGPIWWAAVGPEGRGSLAACASNRVFATDSASSSPVDGDSQDSRSKRAKWRQWADQQLEGKQPASEGTPAGAAMFDEAQPGMTAPPGADDSMGETAEDLTAPAVQEPPFSSADLQEPSPSPAQDASTTMGTHPTEDATTPAAPMGATEAMESGVSQHLADHAAEPELASVAAEPADVAPPAVKLSLLERLALRSKAETASKQPQFASVKAQKLADTADRDQISNSVWDEFAAQHQVSEPPPPLEHVLPLPQPIALEQEEEHEEEWEEEEWDEEEWEEAEKELPRAFRGEGVEVGVAPPNTDPRYGYAILGKTQAAGSLATPGLDGAGRPVPLAPSRLHPTRDFYPGQFYRPSDLNPFVEVESNQWQSTQELLGAPMPKGGEVLQKADFRNTAFLAKFITDTGRIASRRRTGLQAKLQRKVARQIKLAKQMALAPIDTRPPQQPRKAISSCVSSPAAPE